MIFKKTFALIAIYLIIFIPIHVSTVMAAGVTGAKAFGQDGREGFLRDEDLLKITFEASLQGVDFSETTENLRVGPDDQAPGEINGVCVETINQRYACYHEQTEAWTYASPWRVVLCKDLDDCSGPNYYDARVEWHTDGEAPTIPLLTIDKDEIGKEDPITVTLQAQDHPAGDACSGIAKVEIGFRPKDTEALSNVQTLTPEGFPCLYSPEPVEILLPDNIQNGEMEMCAKATDGLQNAMETPKCEDFYLDTAPPSQCQLTLTNQNDQPIHWLSTGTHTLKMKADFVEAGLGVSPSDALLDITELEFSSPKIASSCAEDEENPALDSCTWTFPVTFATDATYTASVNLTDKVGNVLETACTPTEFTLNLDNGEPIVEFFNTTASDYYGPHKAVDVFAVIRDTGGIDPETVKVNLGGLIIIDQPSGFISPTSKEESLNRYNWEGVRCPLTGCPDSVIATLKAQDLAGNDINIVKTFNRDNEPPTIVPQLINEEKILVDLYTGTTETPIRDLFKRGDLLNLFVHVKDPHADQVWIKANLSKFSGQSTDDTAHPCLPPDADGLIICELKATARVPTTGELTIQIGDMLNNNLTHVTDTIEVLNSTTAAPDFFFIDLTGYTYQGGLSLPPVDRFGIMNNDQYPVWVYFDLNHSGACTSDNVKVLNSEMKGFCDNGLAYVSNTLKHNTDGHAYLPGYFELELKNDYI
ncbi:MAG: hypothetical protein ABIH34_04475, partial [Nanoarchaeota archaeon]